MKRVFVKFLSKDIKGFCCEAVHISDSVVVFHNVSDSLEIMKGSNFVVPLRNIEYYTYYNMEQAE